MDFGERDGARGICFCAYALPPLYVWSGGCWACEGSALATYPPGGDRAMRALTYTRITADPTIITYSQRYSAGCCRTDALGIGAQSESTRCVTKQTPHW